MLSYADWAAQRGAPANGVGGNTPAPVEQPTAPAGQLSFADWQAGRQQPPQAPTGPLDLPTFNYVASEGLDGQNVGAYLADYYGQMGSGYGSQVSQFATDNAGQMVNWNPDQYMTIEDFGLRSNRGSLRNGIDTGYYIGDQWYAGTPDDYFHAGGGGYRSLAPADLYGSGNVERPGIADGTELFTGTERPGTRAFNDSSGKDEWQTDYTSAGTYRKETEAEAWARMVAQGGAYDDKDKTNTAGFGSEGDLANLSKDNTHKKYGPADPVNIPELAQYIDDPNWVQRGEDGQITGMRAELMPYVFGQELSDVSRELQRGGTPEADVAGKLIGSLVLGIVTGGLGIAGAAAAGLTTAGTAAGMAGAMLPAGTALSTGGLALSSGIGAGLNTAINGGDAGDFVKNFAMGGLGSYAGAKLTPTISNAVGNSTVGGALSGGLTRGGLSALSGGNFGDGFTQGAVSSLVNGASRNYLAPALGDAGVDQSFANWLSSTAGKTAVSELTKKRK